MTTTPHAVPSTMQAFVISPKNTSDDPLDNGTLIPNHPIPTIPNEKYALIQILRAGICNTDLEILQGYMGFEGILVCFYSYFIGCSCFYHERCVALL
jgi:D-arabinose 1-dehydrogenase-like Zn-dependent alcohol dehydrogenase